MISHFRHLRTYFHQIFNTRRQLSGFTLTVPIQSNVYLEVTRKLSVCTPLLLTTSKPLPTEIYSAHSKEKLLSAANRRHLTSQILRRNFSSKFNDSRQSERDARTLMVAGLSRDTTVVALDFPSIKRPSSLDWRQIGRNASERRRIQIICGRPSERCDLYNTFSKNGKLVHWQVMRDRRYKTNRSLGFAYLAFSSAEDVDRVMDGRPYYIHGTTTFMTKTPVVWTLGIDSCARINKFPPRTKRGLSKPAGCPQIWTIGPKGTEDPNDSRLLSHRAAKKGRRLKEMTSGFFQKICPIFCRRIGALSTLDLFLGR
ncbi:RNA recognition motif domain-containing protein [Ditylenchus destructor]|nr:RNA recognition motif domain-containing protein [Ditylenchus destructor]